MSDRIKNIISFFKCTWNHGHNSSYIGPQSQKNEIIEIIYACSLITVELS